MWICTAKPEQSLRNPKKLSAGPFLLPTDAISPFGKQAAAPTPGSSKGSEIKAIRGNARCCLIEAGTARIIPADRSNQQADHGDCRRPLAEQGVRWFTSSRETEVAPCPENGSPRQRLFFVFALPEWLRARNRNPST